DVELHEVIDRIRALFPVSRRSASIGPGGTLEAPYALTSKLAMLDVAHRLNGMQVRDAARHATRPSRWNMYLAIMVGSPLGATSGAGLTALGLLIVTTGNAAIANVTLDPFAPAHELGHILGRGHAPCGTT